MLNLRVGPRALGRERAEWLARRYGQELRIARVTAGLTQMQLAKRAGVSQTVVSRAERGIGDPSLDLRCRLAAATGHELGWRLYPVATVRLRDSGQLALARMITGQAHASWTSSIEMPVAAGDARAADLVLEGPQEIIHIEIERSLVDVQAQTRAAQLKREALMARFRTGADDGRPVRLVVAVPDTHTTRVRLSPARELLDRVLPASTRRVWDAIRTGTPLGQDGLLFVRAGR